MLKKSKKNDAIYTASLMTVFSIIKSINILDINFNELILTGGGRKNNTLIKNLENLVNKKIIRIDQFDIDGDYIESQAFGYLSIRSLYKKIISFPSTTKVSNPITGGELVSFSVAATDNDINSTGNMQDLSLEVEGGQLDPLLALSSLATFTVTSSSPGNIAGDFAWPSNCDHMQDYGCGRQGGTYTFNLKAYEYLMRQEAQQEVEEVNRPRSAVFTMPDMEGSF